jgi:hypothetical protein
MLENMQLEEEQGQEANVGGEGQAAYLDRLRVLKAVVAQQHQEIDRLTNYFAQEHERVNLFSNQLHLLPRAVVVAAGMQADAAKCSAAHAGGCVYIRGGLAGPRRKTRRRGARERGAAETGAKAGTGA